MTFKYLLAILKNGKERYVSYYCILQQHVGKPGGMVRSCFVAANVNQLTAEKHEGKKSFVAKQGRGKLGTF